MNRLCSPSLVFDWNLYSYENADLFLASSEQESSVCGKGNNSLRKGSNTLINGSLGVPIEDVAATRIQTAFRGYKVRNMNSYYVCEKAIQNSYSWSHSLFYDDIYFIDSLEKHCVAWRGRWDYRERSNFTRLKGNPRAHWAIFTLGAIFKVKSELAGFAWWPKAGPNRRSSRANRNLRQSFRI